MGPAAAAIVRLKTEYRYHFLLKSASRERMNAALRAMLEHAAQQKIPRTNVVVDVDALVVDLATSPELRAKARQNSCRTTGRSKPNSNSDKINSPKAHESPVLSSKLEASYPFHAPSALRTSTSCPR